MHRLPKLLQQVGVALKLVNDLEKGVHIVVRDFKVLEEGTNALFPEDGLVGLPVEECVPNN